MRSPDSTPDQAHYLGVDIGGTKVALRVETDAGCVDESAFAWAPRRSATLDLVQLADHVDGLRERLGTPLRAVGVAMPATVGPAGRVAAWPSRPEWTGLELEASLRTLFPEAQVAWADDGDLGALAEAEESGCDDVLYLGVGTGIGGGLLLGGALCPGLGRGSFEIGHMIVEIDGVRCVCGRRGCLQAIASGPATLRRAALLRGRAVSFDDLRQAVGSEQLWAVAAVEQSCRAVAAAVAGVQEMLHPRLALIGGGFATSIPGFTALVSAHLADLARPGHPPLPVAPAALGSLSSLRGAVALARRIVADPPDLDLGRQIMTFFTENSTEAAQCPVKHIEMLSPELVADPFTGYDRMREQAPLLTGTILNGPPVWLVTRYDDVRRVLTEPIFLTNPASVPGSEHKEDGPEILKQLNIPDEVVDMIALAMMNLDGPSHTRLRRLVSRAFTARRVAEQRPRIEEITAGLLDKMAKAARDGSPVDLVSEYCYPVPIAVICEMVGIDEEDRPQWHRWGRVLSLMQTEHLGKILRECSEHVQQLITRRRAEPRDDMITALIQAQEEDGDRLTDREMVRLVFTMVTAGHESTTYLLGNSLLALLENPDQLALLRAEPHRWQQAVRELMRLGPSQFAQARYTAEEIELGGVMIPAGSPVVPLLLSANTDPRKYEAPGRLDITRSAGSHLGFGMGSHYCLGAPLAYQEAEVALQMLFDRFPNLSLAVERSELPWALRPGFTRVAELPIKLF